MPDEVEPNKEEIFKKIRQRLSFKLEPRLVNLWEDSEMVLGDKTNLICDIFKIEPVEVVSELAHNLTVKITEEILNKLSSEKFLFGNVKVDELFVFLSADIETCLRLYSAELGEATKIRKIFEKNKIQGAEKEKEIRDCIVTILEISNQSFKVVIEGIVKEKKESLKVNLSQKGNYLDQILAKKENNKWY